MTLSRYDEWTGTFGTRATPDANYGLYAFRNPNTAYQRAYWHPGIGIWQYDSAGLGAPLTTVEAMDVRRRRRPTSPRTCRRATARATGTATRTKRLRGVARLGLPVHAVPGASSTR